MRIKPFLSRDVPLMAQAHAVAQYGEHRVRVGCIAAVNNKVLAGAFNTYRNPVGNVPFKEATKHAEVNTISLVAKSHYPRLTLYVARVSKDGKLQPSKPCDICLIYLTAIGVRNLVFIDENGGLVRAKIS